MAGTNTATSVKADPQAWQMAVAIVEETDGDVRRIEVVGDGRTLVVRNRPTRR